MENNTPIKPISTSSTDQIPVTHHNPNEPTNLANTPLKHRVYGYTTKVGEIQLILGPMFSGKTTELLRRVRRYQLGNRSCCVIKYAADTRYSADCAATHDQIKVPAISTRLLCEIQPELLLNLDVIAVDEGCFFPDLVVFCEEQANLGRIVIVAGLDATYERKAFPVIAELIPLAECIIKLSAVCMLCGQDASFTKRTSNEQGLEVIGGADKYAATCRKCYFQPNIHNNSTMKRKQDSKDHNITNNTHVKQLVNSWADNVKKPKSMNSGSIADESNKENIPAN